jgi:hypothetical protein
VARGEKSHSLSERSTNSVGVPPIIFLFTLDQVCSMMNITEQTLKTKYLYYVGRSAGLMPRHMMRATNIAPPDEASEWRVSHKEFVLWLKRMGFRTYDLTIIG